MVFPKQKQKHTVPLNGFFGALSLLFHNQKCNGRKTGHHFLSCLENDGFAHDTTSNNTPTRRNQKAHYKNLPISKF